MPKSRPSMGHWKSSPFMILFSSVISDCEAARQISTAGQRVTCSIVTLTGHGYPSDQMFWSPLY